MSPARRVPLAVAALVLSIAAPVGASAGGSAPGELYPVPPGGILTLEGHGWGHGRGMSQYGAYGAAKVKGLDYRQILAFYYPHSTLVGQSLTTKVRVLLHGTSSDRLVVQPKAGADLTASAKGMPNCVLPTSVDGGKTTVTSWRAKVVSTADGLRLKVQGTSDGSTWTRLPAKACDPAWTNGLTTSITFTGARGLTRLVRSGAVTTYRGALRAAFTGTRVYVVNDVLMESYLKSVVPSEMPSSWSGAALQAQAVAARSYASYGMAHPKNKPYYDVFDDTRDQMYLGVPNEAAASTAAVLATQDAKAKTAAVLHDSSGHPAFAQFSSSDGGWTVAGSQPYLPAKQDPYDGLVQSSVHSWTTTVAASSISSAFGNSLGTLRALVVNDRDGNGQWGGRITSLTLRGTKGDVTLTGADFRYDFGLRSEWFHVLVPPAAPTRVTARRSGASVVVGWQPPGAGAAAKVTGYRVVLSPGSTVMTAAASVRSVTFSGLAPGTDYTVRVAATSKAGAGRTATVTSKVGRLAGSNRVRTAVAASRAAFADGKATGVVLVRWSVDAHSFGAAPLAAARSAPVLLAYRGSLPADTRAEIQRVLPAGGTIVVLGPTAEIGDGVARSLTSQGYKVVRFGGATPAGTARQVARALERRASVTNVFEVSRDDPAAAWVAGAAAAKLHGVVLLTDGAKQSSDSATWLSRHAKVTRYAVGGDAAKADPAATPITAADASALSAAVAKRFFTGPHAAAVADAGDQASGLVAAAWSAQRAAPILLATAPALTDGVGSYVGSVKARLRSVQLVGGRLPYDHVESDLQKALLG
jgi:stage II sporulation protein D